MIRIIPARTVVKAVQCLPSIVPMTALRGSVSLRASTSMASSSSHRDWAASKIDPVLGEVGLALCRVELEGHGPDYSMVMV